jgi:hypothetical protein
MIFASKLRVTGSYASILSCAVVLAVGIFAGSAANAAPVSGSCDFSGSWVLNDNFRINANMDIDAGPQPQHLKIMFTRDSDSSYTGHYVGIDNSSVFTLTIFTSPTGRGQVADMVQNGVAQSGYYAVYVGHVAATSCTIQGTWTDVADNAGDFNLAHR